ncbi:FIST C-terminal domain-containing protein [Oxalobacter vibrioformis]|uniref:FIST C-terminal domain-containing protein n=1 Tax=Oxalobacter vibrioformis TaxID=933080 RepID=A0A9E9P2S5_9BURK|nr:FIST N-terminal domain-containing protein [Oxalobacter vibrioformis]WAW10214.1 FIST C-terminal domain-containing protein [Oxalobacter vibrioformis]
MRAGVGYSENPDTAAAAVEAATAALAQAGKTGPPCDLVLLFSTARHDARILHDSVVSVVGEFPRIVGGGAVGAMTNDQFGYAGDQVGIAVIWLDGVQCDILDEGGLLQGEEKAVGQRLGKKLAALGIGQTSHVVMFYDSFDRTRGDLRLVQASSLIEGMEESLGFFPALSGAGLMGDFTNSPSWQWTGEKMAERHALALAFGDGVQVDSVIIHGCRPITGYYTVTKSEQQTILEINGEPALTFLDRLLGASILPESYPFFLILGINKGDKWVEFNEYNYVNRLCLALDKERKGLVMFESDMVEGTEFQIMHRSLNLDYMKPQIEGLFKGLGGRRPVFAFYIDCAGRAAAYAGLDQEDAVRVQEIVAGRVPLLGLYTGVEIGSVMGRSRALDWTGVFCLFSVPQ